MSLDLLIPGLFTGAAARARHPRLERWLARAERSREPGPDEHAWLAARFGLPEAPVAPVTLAADGLDAAGAWLRADPAHASVRHDTVVLHDPGTLEVTAAEARELVEALQDLFASDGLEFHAPRPDRWYVKVPEGEMPLATPLGQALGRDMFGLLPRGSGRINWPSAMTEAQMILAAHPVNLAREAAGRPAINTVWFWGGGRRPETARSPYARVLAEDPFARGLASLAGVEAGPVPASLEELAPALRGETLVVLGAFADAWLAAMGDALARPGTIRLVLPTGRDTIVARLTAAARWRVFRRARPLADHA